MVGLSGWLDGVGLGRFPCREKTVMETGNVYTTFHAKLLFSGREESHRIQFRGEIPDFRSNQTQQYAIPGETIRPAEAPWR